MAKTMSRIIAGQLDEATEELRAALGELRAALALDPKLAQSAPANLAEIHITLGTLLRNKGRLDEAIEAFRQAVELDRKLVSARHHLGAALLDKGLPAEAAEEFRVAVALDPEHSGAHFDLGRALHDRGQYTEAIQENRKVL
jgi:tetratricopeptide (TPR) repeat protein